VASSRDAFEQELAATLAAEGFSLDQLREKSSQIILFGSRAAGCAHAKSDWDILVVGEGPSPLAKNIDLVWIHPRKFDSGEFFSTELAGHVARYGVWLHGSPDWRDSVRVGSAAVEHKAKRLASRAHALERGWPILNDQLRAEESTLFRRDLQRFELLSRGEPIPPSKWLDDAWQALPNPTDAFSKLAEAANIRADFLVPSLSRGHLPLPGRSQSL